MERQHCDVIIRKSTEQSQMPEVSQGEFVLITWGEIVIRRCIGSVPSIKDLNAGVYLLKVNANCSYSGYDWTLNSKREFTGCISVLRLKVNIRPVNLKSIVNEHVSVKLLNS